MIPLSVCLVVKNEADRLEKSLAPFIGRVSEIIAYDNGSTDGTIEILKKLGVTVVEGPWMGFTRTRKAVWAMAREEWILWLDADEIFPEETLLSLEKFFEEGRLQRSQGIVESQLPPLAGRGPGREIAAFRICRQVVFEGKRIRHGDWFPDWCLRVFRKDAYKMEDRIVHESVEVSGRMVDLPGVVEHHSFRNWQDLEKRSQKYVNLWVQQELEKQGKSISCPFSGPILHASWKFIRGYFLKSGWLDGAIGFKIALHNAREVYSKYQQLRIFSKNRSGIPPLESV